MDSRRRLLRGLVAAALAAIAYTLASPPWDVSVLAWVAPALLLLPAADVTPGRASLLGLVFGMGIAAGITSWAFHASLDYFALDRLRTAGFVVLVWLVYAGLPYAALAAGYSALARRAPAFAHPLVAGWAWVLLEMARSIPVLGMPWGLLSHTQWRSLWLIQVADLGGAYAVTFVVVFVSVSLGLVLWSPAASRLEGRSGAIRLVPAALVLVLVGAYGWSWRAAPAEEDSSRRVAVVQGNVPNSFRWKRAFFERMALTYLRLTSTIRPESGTADLIVWPENAVNFYLDREPMMFRPIRQLARRADASLVVGAPRLAPAGDAHNSAFLIGPDGSILEAYDKRLLVPFAESAILPTTHEASDGPRYRRGYRDTLLTSRGFDLGTLICFEVLFPHLVRSSVVRGANLLVNISNDAWMDAGDGAAPRQHFAMAVFRAIEMRRTLVRASSGGISGFVSPLGEIYSTVPWGEAGATVDTVALRSGLTTYARFGEIWVLLLTIGLIALSRGDRDEPR